jgi:radical SAM protein with 4Fe4S-binding SPASM domain
MVPKIGNSSMSPETFERMLRITEKLLDKGIYDSASFRLSGAEPFLVFNNYKDLVTKYSEKHNGKFSFGILSNLTILTDEMVEWLQKNQIGIQVSLDDLYNSKPLNSGQSSSEMTMKNIIKLQAAKIGFSINTVLDIGNTKSLKELANYVSSLNNVAWGLSASYFMNDDANIAEIIDILKEAVTTLDNNNSNIYSLLRFYNMIINQPGQACSAGTSIFALGTNLEVWPCQSIIDKSPLGYFDENIHQLLETSEGNQYFYNRTLLRECTDCSILNWCRGGCRAVHDDKEAVRVTCKIKQEVMNFIMQGNDQQRANKSCNHQQDNSLDDIIKDYIVDMPKADAKPAFVETPSLPED